MTQDPHLLLGAYILGGLNSTERREFEEHLDQCSRCRADLNDAAPIPALLSRVDPDQMLSGAAEPTRSADIGGLLRAARAARHARRRRTARRGAVAATLVATAIAGAVMIVDKPVPTPSADTYAFTPQHSQTAGVVTLTEKPWGTALVLKLDNLPRSGVFTLRTTGDTGGWQPAANWAATANGVSVLQGATSIPRSQLRQLSIVDEHNDVVATAAV